MYKIYENYLDIIICSALEKVNSNVKHDETISQIEQIFRKHGFYTIREYPIYKLKDGSGRAGRIDLVARKGKFRIAVEYYHHSLIKWKSFQKIVQIKPEVAMAIVGNSNLELNAERAKRCLKNLNSDLYLVSLKQKKHKRFEKPETQSLYKSI